MSQGAVDFSDEELPRLVRKPYDSPSMQDRRHRILLEAQALIAETGVEGFTIRGLSRRAGVAQRTLYNSFGCKEEIIARAITEHHHVLLAVLPPFAADSLASFVDRSERLAEVVIPVRTYAAAMVSVFFSPTIDHRIYNGLMDIALVGFGDFFPAVQKAKIFRELSLPEQEWFVNHLAKSNYALVNDWVAGRIDDRRYVQMAPIKFLTVINCFLRPAMRAEADRLRQGLWAAITD